MASSSACYVSGLANEPKAVIHNASQQYADVVLESLDSYGVAPVTSYDIDAPETGNTGRYTATWPSWLPAGLYTIEFIPLAGATIVESDFPNRFSMQSYYWDGTSLMPDWAWKIAGVLSPVADSGEARVKDTLIDTAEIGAAGVGLTNVGLASNGLDSVSIAEPSGVASNFREMVVQVWRRFFKKATMTATEIKTYNDADAAITTQAVSDDSTTQTQGDAS